MMMLFPMYVCRGVALEALGRFEEAVVDYRAVLAAEPEDPAAWNNLGGCDELMWVSTH